MRTQCVQVCAYARVDFQTYFMFSVVLIFAHAVVCVLVNVCMCVYVFQNISVREHSCSVTLGLRLGECGGLRF